MVWWGLVCGVGDGVWSGRDGVVGLVCGVVGMVWWAWCVEW